MLDKHIDEMRDLEDRYWWFVARRRLAVGLLDDARLDSPTMLDAGCGAGALLAELATRGRAYGADVSLSAIRTTQERGLDRLAQCDIQQAAFGSEVFDAIMLCDVLEHVEDDRRAVAEAGRMLKPGGVLVVTLPALDLLWSTHDEALGHRRRYGAKRLREMLQAGGLRVERLSYGLFFLFPLALIARLVQRLTTRLRRHPPETGIVRVPRPVNRALVGLMDIENALIRKVSLPIGVSLVAVARKVKGGRDESRPYTWAR
ncbi:MAG: class I SAM-dependent methyltransferase [Armatimonadetes bacterium]|nr:class I SAM-dependent methyltransferase [Armatimonadota bacterium]